jgi:replicative DNA helicase
MPPDEIEEAPILGIGTSSKASAGQANTTIVAEPADKSTAAQIPAVGALPDVDTLLVGALLWAGADAAADVLALVDDDDLADPHLAVVLAAVREMEHHSPQLVLDAITRRGVHRPAITALINATTSGATPAAAREYAAAVVASALRRRVTSAGTALIAAADDASEDDLPIIAANAAGRIVATHQRLTRLRGETA